MMVGSCKFIAFVLTLLTVGLTSQSAFTEDKAQELSPEIAILGKWEQVRKTEQGKLRTVKEHRPDNTTILTVYNEQGQKLYARRSEYEVDSSGTVPIFRFGNRTILTGPQRGETDTRDSAYIFRIEGNRFYEISGMLPGDSGRPSLIVWERVADSSPGNE